MIGYGEEEMGVMLCERPPGGNEWDRKQKRITIESEKDGF